MDSYQAALESARKELTKLALERERIEHRISILKKLIEDIIPLIESEAVAAEAARFLAATGDEAEVGVVVLNEGITDVIRRVFVLNDALTPVEVREQLTVMGFDLGKHSNPLATIHSVLKRLVEQGWLEPTEKDGKTAYIKKGRSTALDREIADLSFQVVFESFAHEARQANKALANLAQPGEDIRQAYLNLQKLAGPSVTEAQKAIAKIAQQDSIINRALNPSRDTAKKK